MRPKLRGGPNANPVDRALQLLRLQLGIDLRNLAVGVSAESLHLAQGRSVLNNSRSKCKPQTAELQPLVAEIDPSDVLLEKVRRPVSIGLSFSAKTNSYALLPCTEVSKQSAVAFRGIVCLLPAFVLSVLSHIFLLQKKDKFLSFWSRMRTDSLESVV